MATKRPAPRRAPARKEEERQAKLQAILDAALDVFLEKGFTEARLEDVVARAGVGKGTIYLYVRSKQALLETLIRSGIGGPIGAIEQRVLSLEAPAEAKLRALFSFLRKEILGTRRMDIVRLVLTEAGRFPELAEIYHREVVGTGMRLLRGIAEQGIATGEFQSDALVRFPQLAVAPGVLALLWTAFFQRLDPLDVEGMLETHLALMVRALKGPSS